MNGESSAYKQLRGWMIVAALFVMNGICIGNQYLNGVLVEPLREEFHAPVGSVVMSMSGAVTLAFGLFSSGYAWISHRLSLRLMAIGAMLMVALGYGLLAQVQALWQVTLIYSLIFPLGYMGGLVASNIVINWFSAMRGRMLGVTVTGISVGGFLLPPLGTWAIGETGWRGAAMQFATAILLLAILIALIIVERPEAIGFRSENHPTPSLSTDVTAPTMPELIRQPKFWVLCALVSIPSAATGTIIPNLMNLAGLARIDRGAAAMLMSIAAAAAIFAKLVSGWLFDRVGIRLIALLPQLLLLAACTLFLITPSPGGLMLASSLLGAGMGSATLLMGMLIGKLFGQQAFARVASGITPVAFAMTVATIWASGWLLDAQGGYGGILLLLSAVLAAAVLLALTLHEEQWPRSTRPGNSS